jgi:hypothetical protein
LALFSKRISFLDIRTKKVAALRAATLFRFIAIVKSKEQNENKNA